MARTSVRQLVEVVLPTYVASAFGRKKNSLADIMGSDGNDLMILPDYFGRNPR
jgi:hypothetical protein